MTGKTQVIKCKCGNIFAACHEPHCYTDVEWQRNMRKYVNKGCTVEIVSSGSWEFKKCECDKQNKLF